MLKCSEEEIVPPRMVSPALLCCGGRSHDARSFLLSVFSNTLKNKPLPPPVVPGVAMFAVPGKPAAFQNCFTQKAKLFSTGIEVQPPRRSQQRMPMEDHDFLPLLSCKAIQPLTQINFFRHK